MSKKRARTTQSGCTNIHFLLALIVDRRQFDKLPTFCRAPIFLTFSSIRNFSVASGNLGLIDRLVLAFFNKNPQIPTYVFVYSVIKVHNYVLFKSICALQASTCAQVKSS